MDGRNYELTLDLIIRRKVRSMQRVYTPTETHCTHARRSHFLAEQRTVYNSVNELRVSTEERETLRSAALRRLVSFSGRASGGMLSARFRSREFRTRAHEALNFLRARVLLFTSESYYTGFLHLAVVFRYPRRARVCSYTRASTLQCIEVSAI